MPFSPRHVKTMRAVLDDIDGLAQQEQSQFALRREAVSQWSVAQQLDHALRVCASILGRIDAPGEAIPKKLHWIGRAILVTGYIPRGKGKSPTSLLPVLCSREELRQSVSDTRAVLERVVVGAASESNDRIVMHPMFGGLTAKEAFAFAIIHTRHHLAIVRDILAARS